MRRSSSGGARSPTYARQRRQSLSESPSPRSAPSAEDRGRLLGKGTHGEVFQHAKQPGAAIKVFSRASVMRTATCQLPHSHRRLGDDDDELGCVVRTESLCAVTSREARLQELASKRMAWTAAALRLRNPCAVPEVIRFSEGGSECALEMQQLFPPPGQRTKLIQIASAEPSYSARGDQGHYLGARELRAYLAKLEQRSSLEAVLEKIAFAYACMHFGCNMDAYDVEFVVARVAPEGPARICALDFDKVSQLQPGRPFPYCVCRKISEQDFTPHRIADWRRLYRFLASAIVSSGVVSPSDAAAWAAFSRAYVDFAGAVLSQAPAAAATADAWPRDAAARVLEELEAMQ